VSTLRKKYLEAVLKQDVGFFDTDARTGDIVFSVSTDTLLVQDAISEKVLYQFDIQTPHSLSFFSYLPFCATVLTLFFFFFFFCNLWKNLVLGWRYIAMCMSGLLGFH
jgi:ABC-type multidrug transport system fused ATPase/permease subunit